MMTPRSRLLRALCLVLMVGLTFGAAVKQPAAASAPELFGAAPISAKASLPQRAEVARSRHVSVNAALLAGAHPAQSIALSIFADLDAEVLLERTEALADGGLLWFGRSADGRSTATFALRDGVLAGDIAVGTRQIELRSAGPEALYVLQELTTAFAASEADVLLPPAEIFDLPPVEPIVIDPLAAAAPVIDVLVVYTPQARANAGGTTQINNVIDLMVAGSNTAYANSAVSQRLRLVHKAEVSYTELGGNLQTDLNRLTTKNDGFLEQVHTLRETYKADVVTLLVGSATVGGLGWIMQTPTAAFESYAFNAVLYNQGYVAFAHELGHNMGLAHDRANAGATGSYSYAYGYRVAGKFRDIMAYPCEMQGLAACPVIQHFANPAIAYNGTPTGVISTASNAADGTLTLNNTAATVASFRAAAPVTAPLAPTSVRVASTSSNTIKLSWSDMATNEDGYRVYRLRNGSYQLHTTLPAGSISFIDAGLSCATSYSYQISAFNSAGETSRVGIQGKTSACSTAAQRRLFVPLLVH